MNPLRIGGERVHERRCTLGETRFFVALRLSYDDSSDSNEELMMSVVRGALTMVLSPMPALAPDILATMQLSRSFSHLDTWQIIASPIPRNNFVVFFPPDIAAFVSRNSH